MLLLVNQNFLICLVGLPASGKSTFANILKNDLEKRFNNLEVKIIDPDKIRQDLTPNQFNHKKEHIIRKENLKKIRRELEKGHIVINDDLNYYSSMRHSLKDITDSLNLYFFIVHIATPIEICLKWNEIRGKPIPNLVINKINGRFDKFNKYNWDKADAIYDLSQIADLHSVIEEFLVYIQKKIDNFKCNLAAEAMKNNLSNLYNENLDKITRIYVSTLLHNPSFLHLKKRIIRLRKIYVKENKNKALKEPEISNSFKNYLETNLNIKITENL